MVNVIEEFVIDRLFFYHEVREEREERFLNQKKIRALRVLSGLTIFILTWRWILCQGYFQFFVIP
jgi:hypothetical protein